MLWSYLNIYRLASVIDKLVSRTPTGFIRGRFIGENARLLNDVFEYCDADRIHGLIIALDFKMTFDSIVHKFLFTTLMRLGQMKNAERNVCDITPSEHISK